MDLNLPAQARSNILLCAITGVPNPQPADVKHGDMLTLADYVDCVRMGAFIDDDGYGVWSDGTYVQGYDIDPDPADEDGLVLDDFLYYFGPEPSYIPIPMTACVRPSWLRQGKQQRPRWATHVLWFNK